ncbi:hypothetical protein ACH5RR_016674 [Cinchona calisaya]|uniref:Uncharacterized protein n=1 Tax=Cinchona calisaya TaxID=153742 RepID=A0ABD2ZZS9_9GENT
MATGAAIHPSAAPPPQLYLDEKWKLFKKESSSRSCRSSASFIKNNIPSNNKRCAFTRKCARLVKEQRARFYIMRRCTLRNGNLRETVGVQNQKAEAPKTEPMVSVLCGLSTLLDHIGKIGPTQSKMKHHNGPQLHRNLGHLEKTSDF